MSKEIREILNIVKASREKSGQDCTSVDVLTKLIATAQRTGYLPDELNPYQRSQLIGRLIRKDGNSTFDLESRKQEIVEKERIKLSGFYQEAVGVFAPSDSLLALEHHMRHVLGFERSSLNFMAERSLRVRKGDAVENGQYHSIDGYWVIIDETPMPRNSSSTVYGGVKRGDDRLGSLLAYLRDPNGFGPTINSNGNISPVSRLGLSALDIERRIFPEITKKLPSELSGSYQIRFPYQEEMRTIIRAGGWEQKEYPYEWLSDVQPDGRRRVANHAIPEDNIHFTNQTYMDLQPNSGFPFVGFRSIVVASSQIASSDRVVIPNRISEV